MKELDLQKTRQVNYRRKNLKSWLIDDDDQAPSAFPVITQLVSCLWIVDRSLDVAGWYT